MRIQSGHTTRTPGAVIILWAWLTAGAMMLLFIPPLRHWHETFGWLPFWCVLAPAIDLAILQRWRLADILKQVLTVTRHRFIASPRQAVRRHARRELTWPRRRRSARPCRSYRSGISQGLAPSPVIAPVSGET